MKSTTQRHPGFKRKAGLCSLLQLALVHAYAGPLALSQSPLFLTSNAKANVLMMYGNSNSMDSDPSGKAVGSAAPASKSEVARNAIKSVVSNYTGFINMGLMAYQQNALQTQFLHDSQYDVSFNPASYDPAFNGARNSATKKFRIPNPTSAGNFIYFNVNLPYYSGSNQGYAACYSTTACTDPTHDFQGVAPACTAKESATGGPWDAYSCFKIKIGTSDLTATGAGYSNELFTGSLLPTDSDLGQGITDFGKRLTWQAVSLAWFNNTSPGMGYLHVPIADLNAAQALKINTKLATSQFAANKPVDPAYPLQNAGLSPLQGTVLTANRYFAGSLTQAAQGGPAAAPPNSCSKNFLITLTDGLPSVTKDGVASANVATNLSDLTTEVAALKASASKAETYVVGFALPYGVSITQLDTIAAAGGSGSAYNASDTATLNAAFAAIFADIIAKTSAASAVALNSQAVATGAHVYQAKFSSGDWSGQLLDYGLGAGGALVKPPLWDAGQQLNGLLPGQRVILTGRPDGSAIKGIAFRWPLAAVGSLTSELDAVQAGYLNANGSGVADGRGNERLDYLRGAATNEGTAAPKFRKRPTSKLGDIVNSAPLYVGIPSSNYNLAGYSAYRSAAAARTKMIYVGANDGMLHGFDAANGREKIAYVPNALYPHLSKLADVNYAHRYFVDGSPKAGDVYSGGSWKTVLVSGMGAGARGIFALNVTDPATFNESNAAALVNFEFTERNDDDVGYVGGPISIVKMNNGKFAALFGNGYNSGGSGESALFVVDIETGVLIRKIKTGAGSSGSPNALAAPLVIDKDGDATVDAAYAGDLLGNLWKFDLSDANPNQWKVEYKLFQAPQPITSAPDAGEHPKGGFMVYFGTGKYVEPSDVGSAPGNAMYGIWDTGSLVTAAALQEQTFTDLADIGGKSYRTATAKAIDWATQKGWTAKFPGAAERVVSDPVLRDGRVIMTSIIPSDAVCTAGGTSWLNEVDWLTGGLLASPPFDTNNDGVVDSSDTRVQGVKLNSVASAAAIQKNTDKLDTKLLNESSGEITAVAESANQNAARRLSWRQIK